MSQNNVGGECREAMPVSARHDGIGLSGCRGQKNAAGDVPANSGGVVIFMSAPAATETGLTDFIGCCLGNL